MKCPQCSSEHVVTTTIGIVFGVDINSVKCGECSHRGTAQDWKDIEDLKEKLKVAIRSKREGLR